MKALKHLRDRFEFAIKSSKILKINQLDIEAIDILIQEENERQRNTSIEDALILFYLLMTYKVSNDKNKAILNTVPKEKISFPMGMPEAANTLATLSKMINPKKEVIRRIADELWIYQEYERIPKDKDLWMKEYNSVTEELKNDHGFTKQEYTPIPPEERITYEQVEELLEDALRSAKENFPMFNALNNDFFRFLEPLPFSKLMK